MAPFHAFDLPYHSLMQTEAVEAPARWLYGTLNIEDLWLPFFCISCDLASAEMVVHRRGRVWKAVRATTCLPVVLPPMHLRGRVLVDGGVVDNTPIETMRRLNPGPNILVNVSPDEDDLVGDDVLALPANRQVVAWRLHPLLPSVEVPNLASVIVRTMTVSSSGHQPEKLADLTLRPAIDGYGVVDFEAIDELVALGYNAAMEVFEARADDAAFLGRFGLVPEQVVAPLPRVEVPYWQGIARRKRAARKRVALQSALGFVVALVLGAVVHTLWSADQPWLPTLVGALVIGLVPPLRALSAREAT
jgi:predicted acylesterase/phospholipase RssA